MNDEPMLKRRQDDLAWREFAGEGVLLDLRASRYMATNEAATILWRELDRGTTEHALAAALVDAFDISAKQAAEDVRRFVEDCRARGLLD